MVSSFGWLDGDERHREKMLEVIKLFQDASSVDELGIGGVRDAFSDRFFPATSVLHTRARYLLFVPWCLNDVTRHAWASDKARAELKKREIKLIKSLLKGGEKPGVIGNQAQDNLKTMPSSAYWAALRRLGICKWDTTIQGHLRRAALTSAGQTERIDADYGEVRAGHAGVDASLPCPPDEWLSSTTFDLTPDEGQYLRSRLVTAQQESVFAWLALRGTDANVSYIWEHPQFNEFPSHSQSEIDHAKRFHHVMHGAAIFYNLLLARQIESGDLIDDYSQNLTDWESELTTSKALEEWDLDDFWRTVAKLNPRAYRTSRTFINEWVSIATAGDHTSDKAVELLRRREWELKRNRSRLINREALHQWRGRAGMARLDYRWNVAARHLSDIYDSAGEPSA